MAVRSFWFAEHLESRRLLSGTALQTLVPFGPVPNGDLVMDATGNLYGTTQRGGQYGYGFVYVFPKGSTTLTPIASFNGTNGVDPVGGLVIDANGNLFGTTSFTSVGGPGVHTPPTSLGVGGVGSGTIFEIVKGSGVITTLAVFNGSNGADPQSTLVMDSQGNLYGTTLKGGADNDGTVFELPKGASSITPLASFNGADGRHPLTSLLLDAGGNLFGTAELGGANGDGTIFEVAQNSNAITLLASLNGTDGALPLSPLVADGSGNLYGTASVGGPDNAGTVFEIALSTRVVTRLAFFNRVDGAAPRGDLVLDSSGDLFGTAHVGGAARDGNAFEIVSGSGAISVLASFNADSGAFPVGLITDATGDFFGATQGGGLNGRGTLFRLVQGGTPADPGALTASIVRTTLPSTVIAGSFFDSTGLATQFAGASVTDGSVLNGTLRLNVYASTDQAIDSSSILIATTAQVVNEPAHQPFAVSIPIVSIPASLPAGFYTLLAQAVDQYGNSANATTGVGIQVVAPLIALSEAFTALTLPSAILSGANTPAVAIFKITNSGNIPTMGPIIITLYASPDGTVANGKVITITSKNPIINPGASAFVGVPLGTIPLGLNGTYQIVAKFTDPLGNITSIASTSTVAISAPIITLSASIDSFTPTTINPSATPRGTVEITLSNSGNVPAGGLGLDQGFSINLGLASQAGANVASLQTFTLPVVLRPGVTRTFKLAFAATGLSGALAGTYFPSLTVSGGGLATPVTTTGSTAITIS